MGTLANIIWGVSAAWAWAVVIGLALACIAFSVWVYSRQARSLPRVWWFVMLGLRIAALLAICFSLLEPGAIRTVHPSLESGIAILIDSSASMSAIDTADAPAEQVAVAAALNLFPLSLRNEKFLDLHRRVEALVPLLDETRGALVEWQYARLTSSSAAPVPAGLASRWRHATMGFASQPLVTSLPEITNGIDQPGWADQAQGKIDAALENLATAQKTEDVKLFDGNLQVRQACATLTAMTRLERARAGVKELIDQLPPAMPIYGAVFDSSLRPISLRENGRSAWPDVQPVGMESNISGALGSLHSRMGSTPLRAVVLFSDGRQQGGSLAIDTNPNAPPVFPILCAGVPRDLVLSSVTAPAQAYLDEPIAVDAQVRAINLPGAAFEGVLRSGNLTQIQPTRIERDEPAVLHFIVPTNQAGHQSISVSLSPAPGEATVQNNRAAVQISTNPQRMKLMLIASFPNRDFQFLREQLRQTPWIDSTIILPGDSISPGELSRQQVILLDDLATKQLTAAEWSALREAVLRYGAGLILVAGSDHLPSEYLSDAQFASLLPFDTSAAQPVWRTWAGADAYFRFLPTDAESRLLRLEEDSIDITPQWNRLPAMYHYLQMPSLKPSAQPLLIERESASPVLTQMPLGAGRAIFVGFNETWRWRRLSVAMQRRFWMQLIRHAAPLGDELREQRQNPELADITPDAAFLSRLAASSTGRVYSLSDIPHFWERIQQYEQAHPRTIEYALWHSPWLFGLILGLFGAEWALRKRFGLA